MMARVAIMLDAARLRRGLDGTTTIRCWRRDPVVMCPARPMQKSGFKGPDYRQQHCHGPTRRGVPTDTDSEGRVRRRSRASRAKVSEHIVPPLWIE